MNLGLYPRLARPFRPSYSGHPARHASLERRSSLASSPDHFVYSRSARLSRQAGLCAHPPCAPRLRHCLLPIARRAAAQLSPPTAISPASAPRLAPLAGKARLSRLLAGHPRRSPWPPLLSRTAWSAPLPILSSLHLVLAVVPRCRLAGSFCRLHC